MFHCLLWSEISRVLLYNMWNKFLNPILLLFPMSKRTLFLTACLTAVLILGAVTSSAFERKLYNKTVTIAKGQYFGIGVSVKANETYAFSFNASVPVDFVIITDLTAFNDSFFSKDNSNVEYLQNYAHFNVTEVSLNFTYPEDGRFYFIIENADFFSNGAIGYDNCTITLTLSQIIYSSPGFTWLWTAIVLIPLSWYIKKQWHSC